MLLGRDTRAARSKTQISTVRVPSCEIEFVIILFTISIEEEEECLGKKLQTQEFTYLTLATALARKQGLGRCKRMCSTCFFLQRALHDVL